ncbi:alkaline phosphatase family protein [Halovenus sp. HT40]|uniref:alkaline phosphatase family protein n=1 Tax=Halovenus sp. HT40 TaxID=3126691 RepID=UPI00300F2F8C
MGSEQVLVVGLDGVDFRYLDRFTDDLPNITALRDGGVEAPLTATHPPWTGSAWPSMYTGLDPSTHGVYDFFDYRDSYPDEAEIVSRNDVDAPAIWNYLSAIDRTSIVLNVPVTHPAEQIDGVVVPGYLAPADEGGHPEGIRDELSDALGEPYRIYASSETSEDEPTASEYAELIRSRASAATYLMETTDWDFAFIQVQKTDTVFHNFSEEAVFRRVFRATDDLVGRLTDHVDDETTVVLVSDHGMGPTSGELYLNDILEEHGYVETTANPTNLELSGVKSDEDGGESDSMAALARVSDLLGRIGLGPQQGYRIAQRLGIEQQIIDVLPELVTQSLAKGVDWRASQAYCRRTSEQGIRINLAGRDESGVVTEAEYEQLRDELVKLLSNLETDRGEKVFESVKPREAVYDGPYAEHACDILFQTASMDHEISTNFHGRAMRSIDSHNHKQHGIFVASGPSIDRRPDGPISLLAVAPMLFGALEAPVPERLADSLTRDILSKPIEQQRYDDVPFGRSASYSQDRTEVTDRLEDLGYL